MAKMKDQFANIAALSAAVANGSLGYSELLTGISLGSGVGLVIDQIDYYVNNNNFVNDNDNVWIGWSVVNNQTAETDLAPDKKSMIHTIKKERHDIGTPANTIIGDQPISFSFFPSIIVAAPRIFLVTWGDGTTIATVYSRLYYRYIELSSQEYLELAETFVLVG